jgi:flagellar hook-length control protein FliK
MPPAKAGKTDPTSASSEAKAGDKTDHTKKDAAAADATKVSPALIAPVAPVPAPTDRSKTTDTAKAADTVQAAVTANAAKTAPAAKTQAGSADAAASAAPAEQNLVTPQGPGTPDESPTPQTPSQAKAPEAGTPVANAVARSRAAPESAVVLPKVAPPAGKAAREKESDDNSKATMSNPGDAGESSGIAAPDPNARPTAAANTRPGTAAGQTSARESAPQPHHAASDASSNSSADKTDPTGDPGLAGPAGAGTAMAATSTSHAAATPSTPSGTAVAPPPSNAPVPLAGIPLAIAGRAQAGERHFDIRLDPPELGRIEVRMKVDRDGRITSHLIADRHDTLDLLRRDGAGLERALQDAGLKTAGDGLQFSLRDQSSNTGQDGRQNLTRLVVQDDIAPVRESLPLSYGRLAGRIGGLDIRV